MLTVAALAEIAGGMPDRASDVVIRDVADLASAGPTDLSFCLGRQHLPALRASRAGAALVVEAQPDVPCVQIVCAAPKLALVRAAAALTRAAADAARASEAPQTDGAARAGNGASTDAGVGGRAPACPDARVDPRAHVDPSAQLGPGVIVEPMAVVAAGARLGPRARIGAGAYVGPGVTLGADCVVHPGARILARATLGHRVVLYPGAVIGSDGFGMAHDPATGARHRMPQRGSVVLGDDVEVGANSCVDRGTFGDTRIGAGTKIDNQVQVGHNVELGRDNVIVAQSGIAGSSRFGDRVVLGAQGGAVDHVTVASDAVFGARAGILGHVRAAGIYSGAPVLPHREWLRLTTVQRTLPEMHRTLHRLAARRTDAAPTGAAT